MNFLNIDCRGISKQVGNGQSRRPLKVQKKQKHAPKKTRSIKKFNL